MGQQFVAGKFQGIQGRRTGGIQGVSDATQPQTFRNQGGRKTRSQTVERMPVAGGPIGLIEVRLQSLATFG